MNSISPKKGSILTQEAFDSLLDWLHSDREQAGQKYEEIRRRLMKFFEWHGCPYPADQTDQTINRVASKIGEGVEVLATSPYIYFSGVARNVLKEYWRCPEREMIPIEEVGYVKDNKGIDIESKKIQMENKFECLEYCLQNLPYAQRELITEYYKEEEQSKIKIRKKLAERLGIPLNALRIRACRIRENLEQCITNCLEDTSRVMK